jgi:transposase InsO family protein
MIKFSKEVVYRTLGSSRQAIDQYWQREYKFAILARQLEVELLSKRTKHPGLGLKKAYDQMEPEGIGRDRFVALMMDFGHGLRVNRSHIRTTRSGLIRFPNLIKLLIINCVNRVWQSDTTYFRLGVRFVYLTFIIDVYSRRIVGYSLSESLRVTANVKALKMALKNRQGVDLSELIFHTDGATQYRSEQFVSLLRTPGISSSMCDVALDNAYAEKINDVIKNEYLGHWHIQTMSQLSTKLRQAVDNYNTERHHGQLPVKLAPSQYESYLSKVSYSDRMLLLIKDGQGPNTEAMLTDGHNLPNSPFTLRGEGVTQIMPAFVHFRQAKNDGQLRLAV